jgi:hypothetical protein
MSSSLSILGAEKRAPGVFHQLARDSGLSGDYFMAMPKLLATAATTTTRTIRGRAVAR